MMDVEKQIEQITKLAYDIGAYPVAFKEELRTLLSSAQSREQAAPQAVQAAVPVAWRLTNTAFRKPRFEYHDTKESAELRQADFNRSVDDGGLHNLTPLYAAFAATQPAAQGVDTQGIAQKIRSLPRYSVGKDKKGEMHTFPMQDGPFLRVHEVLAAIDAALAAQAKQGGAA